MSETLEISVMELITGEENNSTADLNSEENDQRETEAWKKYAVREKRKGVFFYSAFAVLTALFLTGFILALYREQSMAAVASGICCILAGGTICLKLADPRIRDWKKQAPVSTQAIVLGKKIRVSGGGNATGYPCIVVRVTGDQKKFLDTVSWDAYDCLFPGDQIRIRYQGFVLLGYEVLYRGPVSKENSRQREAEAQFIKSYVKTVARWRHFTVAEFHLDNGERLVLRVPEQWKSPENRKTGTLRWHGETLDDFMARES